MCIGQLRRSKRFFAEAPTWPPSLAGSTETRPSTTFKRLGAKLRPGRPGSRRRRRDANGRGHRQQQLQRPAKPAAVKPTATVDDENLGQALHFPFSIGRRCSSWVHIMTILAARVQPALGRGREEREGHCYLIVKNFCSSCLSPPLLSLGGCWGQWFIPRVF